MQRNANNALSPKAVLIHLQAEKEKKKKKKNQMHYMQHTM